MFGLFRKQVSNQVYSPADGIYISIEEVNDIAFSQKMLGEGFGIIPDNGMIVAPFDCKVVMVFPTLHAIGLKNPNGIELLIHVGINTIEENGKGFESLVKKDRKVKAGTPLLIFDKDYLVSKGYDVTLICVFTNGARYEQTNTHKCMRIKAGATLLFDNVKL